jgi:hypothetical protein
MNQHAQSALNAFRRSAPESVVLSDKTLTHMLYLLDWKNTLVHGKPLNGLAWTFGASGPEAAALNLSGGAQSDSSRALSDSEMVDFVIHAVIDKTDVELTRLVYSTYPIITGQKHATLDLVACAKAYQALTKKRDFSLTWAMVEPT